MAETEQAKDENKFREAHLSAALASYVEYFKGLLTMAGIYATLCSAILGITITFIDNIVPEDKPLLGLWLLYVGWGLLGLTLLFLILFMWNLTGLQLAQTKGMYMVGTGGKDEDREKAKSEADKRSGRARSAMLAMTACFLVGVAILAAFAGYNLWVYRDP